MTRVGRSDTIHAVLWKLQCTNPIQHPGWRNSDHRVQVANRIRLFVVPLVVAANSACWQPAGSALYRVNYIQLHCPAQRHTLSSRKFTAAVMLAAALTVSHLFCSQRCFTSALVRSASDEEKTCESVTHTHGCTHDGSGQTWLAEEERGPMNHRVDSDQR